LFLVLKRPNEALVTYRQLLTYTKSAVTRNYSEKSINGILDYVGGGKGGSIEVDILEKFYQATKDALVEAKNEVRARCVPFDRLVSDHPWNSG
jgi:COP9 signalosome complex subunit 2